MLMRRRRRAAFSSTRIKFLEEAEGGGLDVRFRSGGMLELAHHLFTWGDTVQVLAPENLRDLLLEKLRAALDHHLGGA